MGMFDKTTSVISGFERLHPEFAGKVVLLDQFLTKSYKTGVTKTLFKIYETFRYNERQDHLFRKGMTKARAGQSAHNYGLAVDFVPYVQATDAFAREKGVSGWNWDQSHDWDFLKKAAVKFGLEAPIKWDRAHVQLPGWKRLAK